MTSPSTDRKYGLNTSVAIKSPARAATTATITLSGEQTIDGVALVTGDRCLVKNQTNGIDNGIYVVDTGAWTRDIDFNGTRDCVQGTLVFVTNGTANAQSSWQVSTANPITLGTTSLAFISANTVTLASSLSGTSGAGFVGWIRGFTGAIAYTLGEFLGWQKKNLLEFMTTAQRIDVLSNAGTLDVSAAIQAAFTNGGVGDYIAPAGSYKVPSGFTIGQRQNLKCEGQQATKFLFNPVADDTPCIVLSNGASVCNQNSLETFSIVGSGAKRKIGIQALDTSFLDIFNVAISGFNTTGSDIGIQTQGREFTTIRKCQVAYCDKPLVIKKNVHGGIVDCDHMHLSDNQFISTAGNYHITVDKGVAMSNYSMDGDNACPYGDGVFYWDDTGVGAGTTAAINMSFKNIRAESQADATKYLYYIVRDAAFTQNLSFENIYGGLVSKGIKLRNVTDVSFKDTYYINGSNNEALNVDATVWKMNGINVKNQSGTTATLTGQRLLQGTYPVAGPMPDNFNYETTTGGVANFAKTYTMGIICDGVVGRVIRQIDLHIQPGTNPSTLKCTVSSVWNGDTIAVQDNIAKNATTGKFSLDAGGGILSILATGITGTLVAVTDYNFRNNTGTVLYSPQAYLSGGTIAFNVKSDNSGTSKDLTALADGCYVGVTYITSA